MGRYSTCGVEQEPPTFLTGFQNGTSLKSLTMVTVLKPSNYDKRMVHMHDMYMMYLSVIKEPCWL